MSVTHPPYTGKDVGVFIKVEDLILVSSETPFLEENILKPNALKFVLQNEFVKQAINDFEKRRKSPDPVCLRKPRNFWTPWEIDSTSCIHITRHNSLSKHHALATRHISLHNSQYCATSLHIRIEIRKQNDHP